MTNRQEYTVPRRVLTNMLISVVVDASQVALETWSPGGVVRFGDPFGSVFVWLWRADEDRAVQLFADILWAVRHSSPNSTMQITLDAALDGFGLDLMDETDGEHEAMLTRLQAEVPALHGRDPNATA